MVRIHLVPSLGKIRLDRLNALQVQSLYSAKLESGLSARTVRMIHTTLHKALKQAVRWSLIPRNVAEAVDPPREQKREIRPLDEEQVKKLLETVRGDKLEALYVLAVTTGMRSGELLGLRWEDVDLRSGTLQVRRTVFNGRVEAPKTLKGKRSVKLPQTSTSALRKHRRVGEWVFCTRVGTPLSVHNVHRRSWKPLLAKTGLPLDTRFHDLRHTCATLLLTKGVHPKIVQEMLGHSSISITLDTYSHVLPNMQGEAVRAMDSLSESAYLEREIESHPDEPEYINDLRILRRFIQSGSFGYRASKDVVFQRLKTRYPEAYSAFGAERRRETLERHEHSPYIAKVEALPYSEYKEKLLKDFREQRKIMILFKLGYGGYAMGMIFGKLKNSHPEAHEAFEEELEQEA